MGKNNHRQNNNSPTSHHLEYRVEYPKALNFNLYRVREKRHPHLNKTSKIIKTKRYSPLPNFNKLINLPISCNSKILTSFHLNDSHSQREEIHEYPLI